MIRVKKNIFPQNLMRTQIRKFVLSLPGPKSYCDCENLCSKVELEHVLPKFIIKKQGVTSKTALNDPHNLYSCCSYINRNKGCKVVGVDYDCAEFNGILSRSCLYMNQQYNLKVDKNWIRTWKNFALYYPPHEFEYERNEIIYQQTGIVNPFLFSRKD